MDGKKAEKNKYVVKKISVVDTFRRLPLGKPVLFQAADFASWSSVKAVICRLVHTGEGKWTLETDDNGVTYTVTKIR